MEAPLHKWQLTIALFFVFFRDCARGAMKSDSLEHSIAATYLVSTLDLEMKRGRFRKGVFLLFGMVILCCVLFSPTVYFASAASSD